MDDEPDDLFDPAAAAAAAAAPLTPAEVAILDRLRQRPPTADWPQTPAAPLTAVAGYDILGELGRGGMGVVYKARQQTLARPVALKVILAGPHAPAELLARFRREAHTLAQCADPGVVAVYDVGTTGGQPYLAMEFCPGGTLAAALAGRPIDPPAAAAVAERLARTLAAVHRLGLVHRDLKPANVLLPVA